VYQVEHTILSWLNLPDDRILQLEAGEDIDEIVNGLDRETTQVKDVKGVVTLTQAAPVIANTILHAQNNPTIEVDVKYLTTARVTKEKSSPFGKKHPGIVRWNKTRRANTISSQRAFLRSLSGFLKQLGKTKEFSVDSWDALDTFRQTATEAELFKLVRRIEWVTSCVPHSEMESALISRLSELGIFESQCRTILERFFYHVFQRLTMDGEKFLTIDEREQILKETLSDEEASRIRRLMARLDQLSIQLGGLEERVQGVEGRLAPLEEIFLSPELLGQGVGLHSTAVSEHGRALRALLLEIGDLSPPIENQDLIESNVLRSAVLAFKPGVWVGITGQACSGKTTLARQLVDKFPGKVYWLRLAGSNQALKLDSLRVLLAGLATSDWNKAIGTLSRGDVVVLEDARLHEASVAERISRVAAACCDHEVAIVTTSHRGPHRDTSTPRFTEFRLEPWTTFELERLLEQSGAPWDRDYISVVASVILGLTKGLPTLATFVVHQLQTTG
jgi:hypothetical protein